MIPGARSRTTMDTIEDHCSCEYIDTTCTIYRYAAEVILLPTYGITSGALALSDDLIVANYL